jgi:hypothetical protein
LVVGADRPEHLVVREGQRVLRFLGERPPVVLTRGDELLDLEQGLHRRVHAWIVGRRGLEGADRRGRWRRLECLGIRGVGPQRLVHGLQVRGGLVASQGDALAVDDRGLDEVVQLGGHGLERRDPPPVGHLGQQVEREHPVRHPCPLLPREVAEDPEGLAEPRRLALVVREDRLSDLLLVG